MRHTLTAAGLCLLALLGAAGGAAGQEASPSLAPNRLEPGQLTVDQIRIVLRARGYTDLERMDRQGDAILVTDAKRYGEATGPLRLDAKTGQVQDERPLTEAQAQALLRDRGFSDVKDAGRDGDAILATAQRAGTKVDLRVDARSGAVSQR